MVTSEPAAAPSAPAAPPSTAPDAPRGHPLWREIPYVVVLVMTLVGVAYTSASQKSLSIYWEISGSHRLRRLRGRWAGGSRSPREASAGSCSGRRLSTGAPSSSRSTLYCCRARSVLDPNSTGITLLMLLALGTFVAGIHLSLRIGLFGLTMALAVPAIAWPKQSALFLVLAAIGYRRGRARRLVDPRGRRLCRGARHRGPDRYAETFARPASPVGRSYPARASASWRSERHRRRRAGEHAVALKIGAQAGCDAPEHDADGRVRSCARIRSRTA